MIYFLTVLFCYDKYRIFTQSSIKTCIKSWLQEATKIKVLVFNILSIYIIANIYVYYVETENLHFVNLQIILLYDKRENNIYKRMSEIYILCIRH